MVTARSLSAGTSYSRGSEVAMAPGAMRTESAPANVRGGSLVTSMALLPRERAMWADVMANGLVPNVFENRTRTVGPPTEMWITWRSVLPVSPGAGGMVRGAGGVGGCDKAPQ